MSANARANFFYSCFWQTVTDPQRRLQLIAMFSDDCLSGSYHNDVLNAEVLLPSQLHLVVHCYLSLPLCFLHIPIAN